MAKKPSPVTVQRGQSIERTIVPRAATPLTEAQAHRMLEPLVQRWLDATCRWTGHEIGDYRFLVLWTDPAPGVQVYVQFWSEPGQLVLCEAASGRWSPPADTWLEGRRAKIESLGFAIGGEAENYQRYFAIDTPKDLAEAARIATAIFFHVFDYRGATPIEAKLTHDGRAELRPVFESFTAFELMDIFEANGFRVEEQLDPNGEPYSPTVLRCQKRGLTTMVVMGDVDDETDAYGRMHLSAEIPLSKAQVAEMRRQADQPADAVPIVEVTVSHSFFGGVTLEWVIERVQEWDEGLAAHKREMRRTSKPPRRSARSSSGETVH